MTDPNTGAGDNTTLPMAEKLVFCKRVGRELPVAEHKECPYCFGHTDEVAAGEHDEFCDFRPGTDPVSFGFPDDDFRHSHG